MKNKTISVCTSVVELKDIIENIIFTLFDHSNILSDPIQADYDSVLTSAECSDEFGIDEAVLIEWTKSSDIPFILYNDCYYFSRQLFFDWFKKKCYAQGIISQNSTNDNILIYNTDDKGDNNEK
jgi:hypothetical protein